MSVVVPESSELFVRWTDPLTRIDSYILDRRVAPVQMGFYFTNPSFSDDGRYLWLYCFFPPGPQASLAVVDLLENQVRHYPETQFLDASPCIDGDTGEAYWATGTEVWKRGPGADDMPSLVNRFPADLANGRRPWRLATHLTRSADRKSFAIDAQIGNQWYVGDLPLDASQPFSLWQSFGDCCYNHAQFSPTDPDLILMAQDGWRDAATGEPGRTQDRLWLIRRGEKARPVLPDEPLCSDHRGHEWWDADGRHVWYIDYRKGTEKVDIATGRRATIWPNGHTHSHNDRQSRYLVGDIAESFDNWRLAFFNIASGKEIGIVSKFPFVDLPPGGRGWSLSAKTTAYNRGAYHVHPHPHFCFQDRYICYTTNVRGCIDIALVSVDQLASRT